MLRKFPDGLCISPAMFLISLLKYSVFLTHYGKHPWQQEHGHTGYARLRLRNSKKRKTNQWRYLETFASSRGLRQTKSSSKLGKHEGCAWPSHQHEGFLEIQQIQPRAAVASEVGFVFFTVAFRTVARLRPEPVRLPPQPALFLPMLLTSNDFEPQHEMLEQNCNS